MTTYDGQKFFKLYDRDSGAVFQDVVFNNCVFDNCVLSLTRSPELRSTVRNVQLTNCASVNCGIKCAIFEEVTVDGLKTNDLLILWAPLFKHVILKGKTGQIKINAVASSVNFSSEMQRPFDVARSRFYETVDWALDISEGQFTLLEMRGVPGRLVRRNPATQVLVTREKALLPGWRERLSPENTYWPMVIGSFLQDGEPDIVLVAPKSKRKGNYALYVEGLNELRRLGVAEPD
ncbi:MAG TPA: hypothetical protein VMS17_17120 [Gemmataceae bacterium]|nr:hypothetical protein [Gemmataceae bacterium]